MFRINTIKISMTLLLFTVVFFNFFTVDAHSISKRQSGPQVQLHRRRRRLERMYNQLLVAYQLTNYEENVENMKPINIAPPRPITDKVRQIIRALNSPTSSEISSANVPRRNTHRASDLSIPNEVRFRLARRMREREQQFPGLTITVEEHHINKNSRRKISKLHSSKTNMPKTSLSRNSLQGHFERGNSAFDLETSVLVRKVEKLCRVVNTRVQRITFGVRVRQCKIHG